MGRRKERRFAAMNAGRRVKLDLFAEPSGDMGGSSAQDEVGGEDDSKNRAGLSNSPSSSGKPQNPLLLLGQYSDDELDEGSQGDDNDQADGSFGEVEEKAEVDAEKNEDGVMDGGNVSVSKKVEQFILEMDSMEKVLGDDEKTDKSSESAYDSGAMVLREQTAPETSDSQAIAVPTSGWKMVLHEESNQYYYWNVVTGETSWEVPEVFLAQGTDIYGDKAAADGAVEGHPVSSMHKDGLTSNVIVDSSTFINENNRHRLELEPLKEGCMNGASDEKEGNVGDQGKLQDSFGPVSEQNQETPVDGVSTRPLSDTLVSNGCTFVGDSVIYGVDSRHQGDQEAGRKLSSHLMELCQTLLERLGSLNRSKDDILSKCTLEVEIRLNDIKSLASHGSALLPFWVHSEKQLLQLEAMINDEINHSKFVLSNESENVQKLDGNVGAGMAAALTHLFDGLPSGDAHAPLSAAKTGGQKIHEAYENGISATDAGDGEGTVCPDRPAVQGERTPNIVLHPEEDEDMDVDMEVEDSVPQDTSNSLSDVPPEQPNLLSPPGTMESGGPEQISSVPPQPDEDWVPPPPPDNEPFPPPPPEEPPETSHPPPDSESVDTLSYAGPYNHSYSGGGVLYYGQASTEVPGTSFYAYSEESQATISQPSIYYDSGLTAYSMTPVLDPSAYYALQDVSLHPTSAAGVDSSLIGSVSGHESFRPEYSHAEAGYTFVPKIKDVPTVGGEMGKESSGVSCSQATNPVTVSASFPSTSAVTTSATDCAAASKGQPKVSRTKKRTGAVVSTLRSNKKVSSLVDKWKAAKEELHEDEEKEPETYLEKLEKKRQREIEEWRAQQIASGEAKENANFQPLGGDWRERVKRRRAQLVSEKDESPSGGVIEGTQQPDLNEISKGLPSGWQAYWDDTSKQIYYGNAVTAETSWVRPAT